VDADRPHEGAELQLTGICQDSLAGDRNHNLRRSAKGVEESIAAPSLAGEI
jgi:hypothetical protein